MYKLCMSRTATQRCSWGLTHTLCTQPPPPPGAGLEAIGVSSLAPRTLQAAPEPALNTTRYKQQLLPWRGDKLVMVGGQFDDRNGASQKTMSMVVLDLSSREWSLRREFTQHNGGEGGGAAAAGAAGEAARLSVCSSREWVKRNWARI